jgi:hypothetical protein
MGQTEQEPDPGRRVPTFLWMALGLLVVMAFVAAVVVLGHGKPRSVGPSAGAIGNQGSFVAH